MKPFMTLVDAATLLRHIDDPLWCVFDCRHDLSNPAHGRNAYPRGHIAGARFLHLDDDLSGPKTGRNGRHPLPDPQALARKLAQCGVSAATQVVAYDDAGGTFAVRLWWLMRWLGHDRVALLDGGLPAWKRAGGTLAVDAPPRERGDFRPLARDEMRVDAPFVLDRLASPAMLLVDARAEERFRGDVEPLDPVAGHIPRAANRYYMDNLDDLQCFLPAQELRAAFDQLLGDHAPEQVVHTCGSGVTACHNVLAMEIAGLPGSRLYAGSWSEWCSDPGRPIAKGS